MPSSSISRACREFCRVGSPPPPAQLASTRQQPLYTTCVHLRPCPVLGLDCPNRSDSGRLDFSSPEMAKKTRNVHQSSFGGNPSARSCPRSRAAILGPLRPERNHFTHTPENSAGLLFTSGVLGLNSMRPEWWKWCSGRHPPSCEISAARLAIASPMPMP